MHILRGAYAVALAAFVAAIGWGFAAGDAAAYMAQLRDDVWLQVTLADLFAGLLVYAAFVWCVERSLLRTLLWVLPALPLGNLVSLAYVVVRWPAILRLAGRPA